MPGSAAPRCRPSPAVRATLLVGLFAVLYTFGLTDQGLSNWHEAQRALVAREMFERREWIVPHAYDQPYISKPPLIYWVQMAIAHGRQAMGFEAFVNEAEVRLAVALGGVLGVLATYLASRRLLTVTGDEPTGERAAWLAALGLGTGLLYFRSARFGELDIWIVPCATAAIACLFESWEARARGRRAPWHATLCATLGACGAALTKGPPALLVILLAAWGAILWRAALDARPRPGDTPDAPIRRRATLAAALAGAIALPALARWTEFGVMPLLGGAFFALLGGALGVAAAWLWRPAARSAWIPALLATRPWFTLLVPCLVVWGWGVLVQDRIGAAEVARVTRLELDDNLRVLVPDAPGRNLGFVLYGAGAASLAAVCALVWMVRDRPRLTRGQTVPLAWTVLGFAAFSALSRGASRYFTPVWPGLAMLGGWWAASFPRDHQPAPDARRRATLAISLGLVVLGVAQAAWYGPVRARLAADRSPRALVQGVLDAVPGARVASFEFQNPAVSYYARRTVPDFQQPAEGEPLALLAWARGSEGTPVLLARRPTPGVAARHGSPLEALARAGFQARELPGAGHRLSTKGHVVVAYRLEPLPTAP